MLTQMGLYVIRERTRIAALSYFKPSLYLVQTPLAPSLSGQSKRV